MEKKGLVFVHEFILNNDGTSPLFPALFSLNMLVNTSAGTAYKENQLYSMMEESGIKNIQRLEFQGPNQSGILFGEC